ncbi:MAG: biotin--[acetyl-CoA-carboxylase] ligase [Prevotella sp.]
MKIHIDYIDKTESTNSYFAQKSAPPSNLMKVIVAHSQSAGRGQGSNSWESEEGKNLTFSIDITRPQVPLHLNFYLSIIVALAIHDALSRYSKDITLKWPNDIYYKDKKISGTLIETSVNSQIITRCIFGIGINVNQKEFVSDAPNPISLINIINNETKLSIVLAKTLKAFRKYYDQLLLGNYRSVKLQYMNVLYRSKGFFPYRDKDGLFEAEIVGIKDNGHLCLKDTEGRVREYEQKEVQFVLPQ